VKTLKCTQKDWPHKDDSESDNPDPKRIVVIESPYSGDVTANEMYLRACMRNCIMRGEAPYASHGLYTQTGVLNDADPEERKLGMRCGFEFYRVAECCAIYVDEGISGGMVEGIQQAMKRGVPLHYRALRGSDIYAKIQAAEHCFATVLTYSTRNSVDLVHGDVRSRPKVWTHQTDTDCLKGPECDELADEPIDYELADDESGYSTFEEMGLKIGELVTDKNEKYGDSFAQAHKLLEVLYPDGVDVVQYRRMLAITRIIDKLFRLASWNNQDDEDPARDIAGYGLLLACAEEEKR
jgi:hypothetical protein